jgi:hypothetical protein
MLGRVKSEVAQPSSPEDEIAVEKFKRCKSPGIGRILAELIQEGRNTLRSEVHKLINSVRNNCKIPGSNALLYLFIKMDVKLGCGNY